jgi:hypothetical protein
MNNDMERTMHRMGESYDGSCPMPQSMTCTLAVAYYLTKGAHVLPEKNKSEEH